MSKPITLETNINLPKPEIWYHIHIEFKKKRFRNKFKILDCKISEFKEETA